MNDKKAGAPSIDIGISDNGRAKIVQGLSALLAAGICMHMAINRSLLSGTT